MEMINGNEKERLYLGGLIYASKNGCFPNVKLIAPDFSISMYGRIFDEILKQHKDGKIVTIISLSDALPDIPKDIIAELTNGASEYTIPFYENSIYEAAKNEAFVRALKVCLEEIDNKTDVDTIIKNLIPALAGVTNAKNEAAIITAKELFEKEFPQQKWIIPGLIGIGLIMIAGSPKIGKSWFMLQLAIAAAYGGLFLDAWANQTNVLLISLEDTDRRLQSRMKILNAPAIDELKITTQWKDGYIGIDNYLEKNPDIGLVIIDTLGRFAGIEDMNDYAMTTAALARLKTIADKREVAIIVVHHARKGENRQGIKTDPVEAALGSTGLTGTVDSTITLFRHRSNDKINHEGTLYITGRDAPDVLKNLTLDIGNGGWSLRQDKKDPQPRPEKSGALGESENNGAEEWK
jgi:archaellum biogenesis ATPase FlaH